MLDVTLLGKDLKPIQVIDTYTDLIWTERYDRAGDFELLVPVSMELIEDLIPGRYLYIDSSRTLMIIETVELYSSAGKGNQMTVTGRSLESILSYRIVWSTTTLDGTLESGIQTLLNNNIISPSDSARRVDNFVFEPSGDAAIDELTLVGQYTGENLYNIVCQICEDYALGFEVYLNDQDQFVFHLLNGADRSFNQYDNPVIEFSPNFDNLLESTYRMNSIDYRTSALVVGKEVNGTSKKKEVLMNESTGLDRRELYIDANDVEQEDGVSDAKYLQMLEQRGYEELCEYQIQQEFDCSIDTFIGPKYGVDYYIGDIVQDEYGIQSQCRVVELIRSVKASGYYEYPTFQLI